MSKSSVYDRIWKDILKVTEKLGRVPSRREYFEIYGKFPIASVVLEFGSWIQLYNKAMAERPAATEEKREPKILVLDIELLPYVVLVWDVWDQNISPTQILQDKSLASCAAMWLGEKEVLYRDQRHAKDLRDDKALCIWMQDLLAQADVIVTQNGKQFDEKVLNTRFIKNGLPPPPPFQHADTKQMAKRRFKFAHNSLEGLCIDLDTEFKKLKSKKFIGQELWNECLKRNMKAWDEMELYNKRDVLATRDVYKKLAPWGTPGINLNVYRGEAAFCCDFCGSKNLKRDGFRYTQSGKFQRYRCRDCTKWTSEKGALRNMITPKKKDSLNGL